MAPPEWKPVNLEGAQPGDYPEAGEDGLKEMTKLGKSLVTEDRTGSMKMYLAEAGPFEGTIAVEIFYEGQWSISPTLLFGQGYSLEDLNDNIARAGTRREAWEQFEANLEDLMRNYLP